MKKRFLTLGLLVILMITMIPLAMAAYTDPNNCSHPSIAQGWQIIRWPTCTKTGWKVWTCSRCQKALYGVSMPINPDRHLNLQICHPQLTCNRYSLWYEACCDCGYYHEQVYPPDTTVNAHHWRLEYNEETRREDLHCTSCGKWMSN